MRVGAILLTISVLLLALCVRAEQEDGSEDVKVDRVLLPADRLAIELEKARQGILVKMSLTEFEERLRRFRSARKPTVTSTPPRLVRALFTRARLYEDVTRRGEESLSGSAEWTVLHRGQQPSVLLLQPLTLALGKVRFENRGAVVGDFDGVQPGLLIDQPGQQNVLFDWSVRGEHTPEGLVFNFHAPPSPLAQLELHLPTQRSLTVSPEGCLLEEEKSDVPDHRLWRIRFAGKPSLQLTVGLAPRPGGEAIPNAAASPIIDRLTSRHNLSAEGEASEFSFELQSNPRGSQELTFACDRSLRPFEVSLGANDVNQLERWEFKENAFPRERSSLVLRFRGPISGAINPRLRFRAPHSLPPVDPRTSTRSKGVPWSCPRVELHPVSPTPRSESIEVSVDPRIWLERWKEGGYRINSAKTEADGTRRVTLLGSGLQGAGAERPGALLHLQGVNYSARCLSWWQLESGSSLLEVQCIFDVHQGSLFEIPIWIAPGWNVENVTESQRADRVRNWLDQPTPPGEFPRGQGGRLLTVDLQPPLEATGQGDRSLTLTLRLRGPGLRASPLPLPVILPSGARTLEGGLAVDWDEDQNEVRIAPLLVGEANPARANTLTPDPLPESGPWKTRIPAHYYSWRGQPLQGRLNSRARPMLVNARSQNEVVLGEGRAEVQSRLTVENISGSLDRVDLRLAAPLPAGVTPSVELISQNEEDDLQIRGLQRLRGEEAVRAVHFLGATNPLALAGACSATSAAELWGVTLSRPLRAHESLSLLVRVSTLSHAGDQAIENTRLHVPLVTFARYSLVMGEVILKAKGGEIATGSFSLKGLIENNQSSTSHRYRHDTNLVAMTVSAHPAPQMKSQNTPGADAYSPRASLVTRVDPDGRLLCVFTFEVRNWPQLVLPVRLPTGASAVEIRADGSQVPGVAIPTALDPDSDPILEIPVPRDTTKGTRDQLHIFEILYTINCQPAHPWARVESVAPQLPLPPRSIQKMWCLPANLIPVGTTGLQKLPGHRTLPGVPGFSLRETLKDWSARKPRALRLDGESSDLEQALRLADQRFRRTSAGQSWSLAEALRQLNAAALADQGSILIVDSTAVAEAGVYPGRQFKVPASSDEEGPDGAVVTTFTEFDLVLVSCMPAPLLTSRRNWLEWQGGATRHGRDNYPPELARALSETLEKGQDSTGRYRTLPLWFKTAAFSGMLPDKRDVPTLEQLVTGNEPGGWTEWIVTSSEGDRILVMPSRTPTVAGLVLLLLLLFGTWAIKVRRKGVQRTQRYSPRILLTVLLLWLGAAGAGIICLPDGFQDLAFWPAAGGILISLIWFISPSKGGKGNRTPLRNSSAARTLVVGGAPAIGLLVLAVVRFTGPAAQPHAAPSVSTVYVLPGKGGTDQEAAVLVSPPLLRRLEERPASTTLSPAVLTDADFNATLRPGGKDVQVDAIFQIHSSSSSPTTLELPLDGVRLLDREPLLDGAATAVMALEKTGYSIRVSGVGAHKLQLSFLASVQKSDDQSELRFTVPRVAQSRLSLRIPGKGLSAQSLVHLGSQKLVEDDKGTLLEVDLGAVPVQGPRRTQAIRAVPLQIRWAATKPDKVVRVQTREAYLWDLGQRGHSLTGVLMLDIGPGTIDRYRVDMPVELSVNRVKVSRVIEEGKKSDAGSGPVGLRDWRVVPQPNLPPQLLIDFQMPVSGRVRIVLECYPRGNLFDPSKPGTIPTAFLVLPVPRPHGTPVPDGGFLGYRLNGLNAERGQILRLVGMDEKKFPDFFKEAVRGSETAPTYACRILRQGDLGPVLPMTLGIIPPRRTGTLHCYWRLSPSTADLRATVSLQAPDQDLALVECELPPATEVVRVSGRDVREWTVSPSRKGTQRLQVWLKGSVSQTLIEIQAGAPTSRLATQARRWVGIGATLSTVLHQAVREASAFQLTPLKLVGVEPAPPVTLEVVAAEGYTLTPRGLNNLVGPVTDGPREKWMFESTREDYGGRFVLARSRTPAIRLVTFVEVSNGQVSFRSRVESVTPADEFRSIRLTLRGWPGKDLKLDASGATVRTEVHGKGSSALHIWEIRRGEANSRPLVLAGKASLDEVRMPGVRGLSETRFLLPEIEVNGLFILEQILVLGSTAASLNVQTENGTAIRIESGRDTPGTKEARESSGQIWRLNAHPGIVWLTDLTAARASIRVACQEHTAAVLDAQNWTYQSQWWLFHDGPAEVTFVLPLEGQVLTVSVDGIPQTVRKSDNGKLTVSLTGTGIRRIVLRWAESSESTSLTSPTPAVPRLLGQQDSLDQIRILHVPRGYTIAATMGYRGGPLAEAGIEIERAAGQLRLMELLLPALGGHLIRSEMTALETQLTQSKQRFLSHLWNVEQLVAVSSTTSSDEEVKRRLSRVQTLREQAHTLHRRHGRDFSAQENGELTTTQIPEGDELARAGAPIYRVEPPSLSADTGVLLISESSVSARHHLIAVLLLFSCLLGVWVLSRSQGICSLARTLWPEQAVLLGAWGLTHFGPTWPVLILLLLGIVARGVILGSALTCLLRRLRLPRIQPGRGLN